MTNQTNLSRLLIANGTFCFTSGIIFSLTTNPLADFLNTVSLFMGILGIGLILYGTWVTYMATRPAITKGFSLFIVIADSVWVLLSILLLVLPAFNFTPDAKWAIGIIAICVDGFATLQFLERRKM